MFQVSGNTYQYETLSVYYTHKHISVSKQQQTASDNKTFVYAYNLLVLGLNRGSPSEEKNKYEKTFYSFTYGTLNRGSPSVVRRLLLLCRHILYGTFHHGSTFC